MDYSLDNHLPYDLSEIVLSVASTNLLRLLLPFVREELLHTLAVFLYSL